MSRKDCQQLFRDLDLVLASRADFARRRMVEMEADERPESDAYARGMARAYEDARAELRAVMPKNPERTWRRRAPR